MMKKNFKYIKNIININHVLVTLGFILFSSFIWLRFIRERLPKIIPFNLSLLGFIFLIYICLIYAYVVVSLIRESSKQNILISKVIDMLYKPLETFDNSWKNISYIKPYYYVIIKYLVTYYEYVFKNNDFYIIFGILPRIILVSVLYIDIFWFYKLQYIYKFLFLGIFLFLNRYIIYSLKMWKEKITINLNLYIETITVLYRRDIMGFYLEKAIEDGTYDPNDPDWDLEDEIPPTFAISLKNYVEIETKSIINDNENLWYRINTTDLSAQNYHKNSMKNKNDYYKEINRLKLELKPIIQTNIILEYSNISKNMQEFINIRILIFTNYLLCWLYILIISLPSLNITHLLILIFLLKTLKEIEEPFTGELLINLESFYL